MESLSLPKGLQITFDRSHRISGASEQYFWNSRFYMVCRVKANGAPKAEYLLNVKKGKKNVYVAKMMILVKWENLIERT